MSSVFVVDLKTMTLQGSWAPESGNLAHLATEHDVNTKLTAEQALRLYNGSVEKTEHLDMSLGESTIKRKLFALLGANKDNRVAAPEKPKTDTRPAAKPVNGKKAPRAAKPTGEKRGRKSAFSPEAKIKVLVKENPKRKGSASFKRFELYGKCKTVAEYFKAGGTSGDLHWDKDHELIAIG